MECTLTSALNVLMTRIIINTTVKKIITTGYSLLDVNYQLGALLYVHIHKLVITFDGFEKTFFVGMPWREKSS